MKYICNSRPKPLCIVINFGFFTQGNAPDHWSDDLFADHSDQWSDESLSRWIRSITDLKKDLLQRNATDQKSWSGSSQRNATLVSFCFSKSFLHIQFLCFRWTFCCAVKKYHFLHSYRYYTSSWGLFVNSLFWPFIYSTLNKHLETGCACGYCPYGLFLCFCSLWNIPKNSRARLSKA